jgi:hypothetical protein
VPRQYAAQIAKYTEKQLQPGRRNRGHCDNGRRRLRLTPPGDHAKQSGHQGEAAAQLPILALLDQGGAARRAPAPGVLAALRAPTHDHPAAALWWRILDELPPTKAEPGPSNPQRRRSDPGHDHHVTRPAATPAALGTAPHVPPEPLKLDSRPITTAGSILVICCRATWGRPASPTF